MGIQSVACVSVENIGWWEGAVYATLVIGVTQLQSTSSACGGSLDTHAHNDKKTLNGHPCLQRIHIAMLIL